MRRLLAVWLAIPFAAAGAPPRPEACLECHDQVDLARFRSRSHGGLVCVDCHAAIRSLPHEEKLPLVRCARCHRHEAEEYDRSAHALARQRGDRKAPWCTTCHGPAHDIVSTRDPASRVARGRMAATCGTCHPAAFLARVDQSLPHRASRMGIPKGAIR